MFIENIRLIEDGCPSSYSFLANFFLTNLEQSVLVRLVETVSGSGSK